MSVGHCRNANAEALELAKMMGQPVFLDGRKGPYQVLEVTGNGSVRLQTSDRKGIFTTDISGIKAVSIGSVNFRVESMRE